VGNQVKVMGLKMVLAAICRLYYSFDELMLVLRLVGLHLPLPLIFKGGGWTDCVLTIDGIRVMKNSRNDTLILQRLGDERRTAAP
jgi:hypothetical protein